MKYRLLLLISLLTAAGAIPLAAQNRIDSMVDTYSTMGRSTLTSAVERNKRTKKIEKIVKVLEISNGSAYKFIKAFDNEKQAGESYRQSVDGNEITRVITTENDSCNRIYMLQYRVNDSSFPNMIKTNAPFKVSIVIKYKK